MMRVRLTAVVKSALVAAVVWAAALSSDASAQQQQQRRAQEAQSPTPARDTRTQRAGERDADANADLSITARVTADSVRFGKVPNTRVDFTGKPERATVWEAERETLPPQVQPGVTYRNIGITLRITSVFADIDRIVAEALGEVPAGDEPRPAQPPATPPAQPPGTPTTAPPASPSPSKTSPANSVTNASRRGPAQRGRGK
ncbi:MAG: hypothetical protein ABW250_09105 [Pyrinomonadaceae bacterium]